MIIIHHMILWKIFEKSGLKGRRRSQILQLWSKDAWPKITAGFIPSLVFVRKSKWLMDEIWWEISDNAGNWCVFHESI